jgi:hypothetical protein
MHYPPFVKGDKNYCNATSENLSITPDIKKYECYVSRKILHRNIFLNPYASFFSCESYNAAIKISESADITMPPKPGCKGRPEHEQRT